MTNKVKKLVETAREVLPRLQPVNIAELLRVEFPPRQFLLEPFLPEKGLAMLVAPRGVGKTFFALTLAYAVSCGGTFLGIHAPKPRRVAYFDGEMPAHVTQERIAAIVRGFEQKPPEPNYFHLFSSDLIEGGLPDLGTVEGQAEIDAQLGEVEFIIIDNLSTIVRTGKENEAESWLPMQEWVLRHRRAGRSILLVHHAGRNGMARGTSRREDVLDTMIALRRPQDYRSDQGARFEVHFEKTRGFFGKDAVPFEAQYEVRDQAANWTRRELNADLMRVVEAIKNGITLRDIAYNLGISKSSVHRLKEEAIKKGLLPHA